MLLLRCSECFNTWLCSNWLLLLGCCYAVAKVLSVLTLGCVQILDCSQATAMLLLRCYESLSVLNWLLSGCF